ncbi:MAG: amidohydrolase [Deltaproteobacteria bacterium]|nr:amidohydrolase [Deltaproteobacteria bacterium]
MQIFKGAIVTCDQGGAVYQYLVEDGGRIIFVGDELPEPWSSQGNIVDLGEKALLPAFGDGHIHFSSWALFNATFDLRLATTLAEVGALIQAYALRERGDKVLLGFGHSAHSVAEQRLITRAEIDAFVQEKPVYVVCYDGHSAIANSAMLSLLPQKVCAQHGFDRASGILRHEAFLAATDVVSSTVSPLRLAKNMLLGMDTLADFGVGLVHTVEGVGFPRDLDVDLVRFLGKSSQLQFRIYFQTMQINKVIRRKLPRVGGCFACALDGCFGVKDAALFAPYSDDPHNRGILFYSDQQVNDFARAANRAGLQIQLHCIGDAAVVQAVNAIEQALLDFPRSDHRHTLIHACLTPEDMMEKIAKLGIVITLQPGFLVSPLEPFSYLERILGERINNFSPYKKMQEYGIVISGGSDAPVVAPDPIAGIHGVCNHFLPEQSLDTATALRLFTYNVAYTTFDERERGSLERGKIADMVVLNRNPLTLAPSDLLELKVEKLLIGGQEYRKGQTLLGALAAGFKNRNRVV